MIVTALAEKKFKLLAGTQHERLERRFMQTFLLGGTKPIDWYHGLGLENVQLFAERCILFDVKLIGFEIFFDSPFPMVETVYEEFCQDYDPYWYSKAIHTYSQLGIDRFIIPYIEVPTANLDKYHCFLE